MFLLILCSSLSYAQSPPYLRTTQLPEVPSLNSRPAQGAIEQQQWRTERYETEKKPVADFLDSLKGNDAAIHVIVNRSKILTTKLPIANENGVAVIAVSDPSVLEFDVLPDSRMIRLIGGRVGITDLTFVTADNEVFSFEVHVGYDLDLLKAQLAQMYPGAFIRLGQLREHLVVEGQARSNTQIDQILNTIQLYLTSSAHAGNRGGGGSNVQPSIPQSRPQNEQEPGEAAEDGSGEPMESTASNVIEQEEQQGYGLAIEEGGGATSSGGASMAPQIINLLKLPGPQQVMLKVQIAELNRTALRQIGSDLFGRSAGNSILTSSGVGGNSSSLADLLSGGAGTIVGVFDSGSFNIVMKALRQNNVATLLAEPNLITLDGHVARFQSGGEFPVPVAQQGGGAGNSTVEFKNFGVQLAFVPYILEDNVIRLHVEPEVSNIAEELGVTLIVGGSPIPGLRTRNASTTVELRPGQTLAIAGLLNREVDSATARIPILGDLPYVGVFFGSRQHQVIEQELIIAVTPYLIDAVNAEEILPLPGQEIDEPNDWEFYLLQRIEGRTGLPHRSTTKWDNPFHQQTPMQLEQHYISGSVGLSP